MTVMTTSLSNPNNESFWKEVYEKHFAAVRNFISQLCKDEDAAYDLAMESYLSMKKSCSRNEIPENARSYWFVAAKKECYKFISRKRSLLQYDAADPESMANKYQEVLVLDRQLQQEEFLQKILKKLTKHDRKLIIMRHLQEWSIPRIAEEMTLTEAATRVAIHRAFEKLQLHAPGLVIHYELFTLLWFLLTQIL